MKKTESNMLFLNGFLGGVVLTMISFMEIYRTMPDQRGFLTLLIAVTGLVLGVVFQFCYMELRATNTLRWAFEQAGGKIPPTVFELHDRQVEPALAFLVQMQKKLQRHSLILLFLNLLQIMATMLVTMSLARFGSGWLAFALIWTFLSHLWVYVLSIRSLKNGRFARMEIVSLLELHRFSPKKRF